MCHIFTYVILLRRDKTGKLMTFTHVLLQL